MQDSSIFIRDELSSKEKTYDEDLEEEEEEEETIGSNEPPIVIKSLES